MTTFLAIWGAITGTLAILWDVYKWKMTGPKLRITVSLNMKMLPDPRRVATDPNVYVLVHATNVGTSKTTITHLAIASFTSVWKQIVAKPETQAIVLHHHTLSSPIPKLLDVGEVWTGMILRNQELEQLGKNKRLFCCVYHSSSKKPASKRIIFPKT